MNPLLILTKRIKKYKYKKLKRIISHNNKQKMFPKNKSKIKKQN
jgi:hypothetical protein